MNYSLIYSIMIMIYRYKSYTCKFEIIVSYSKQYLRMFLKCFFFQFQHNNCFFFIFFRKIFTDFGFRSNYGTTKAQNTFLKREFCWWKDSSFAIFVIVIVELIKPRTWREVFEKGLIKNKIRTPLTTDHSSG